MDDICLTIDTDIKFTPETIGLTQLSLGQSPDGLDGVGRYPDGPDQALLLLLLEKFKSSSMAIQGPGRLLFMQHEDIDHLQVQFAASLLETSAS